MDNIFTPPKRQWAIPWDMSPFQGYGLWQPKPMVKTIGWEKSPLQGSVVTCRHNNTYETVSSVVTYSHNKNIYGTIGSAVASLRC